MAACVFAVCNAPYHGKQTLVLVLKLHCQIPAQHCQYHLPVKTQMLALKLQGLKKTGEREVIKEAFLEFKPLTQQMEAVMQRSSSL